MKYKITNEAALKAAFPNFLKQKTVKVEQTINVLDEKKVKYALKAGITVPGVEAVDD